ncbi:MAG: helix-turn-helix domain-containing protein [Bacillus sp. (in: firmicutes)]
MYTVAEVCKKLGLDRQTVERMCEKGKFRDAHKNENGLWLIPDYNFITSREQDERAEEVLRQINRKNRGGRDETEIPYIPAKIVADYYGATLKK